ncbi:MAG TPA: c-type cytochrome [Chitinophagaceae bacterium]|jgi:cytochrome c|nr:c-type cytochrome [Chitinophagaceae bacterium]
MKKFFLFSFALCLLAACGGNESKSKTEEPKVADVTKDPNYQKGLELVSKSDCFTCHQIEDKLTGPPYREVAAKYAGMPDTIVTHLAGKIISGGSGVWGEILMTPHPALSQADAEAMVRYILLLKK